MKLAAPELLAAFHADGSIDRFGNVTFHFRKQRKIVRLRDLLQATEHTEWKNKDGTVSFYLPHRAVGFLREWGKTLDARCLQWSDVSAVAYLQEQVHWDGHAGKSGAVWMSSKSETHAQWAHTLSHLHGFGSQLHETLAGYWIWSLNARTSWRLSSVVRFEGAESEHAVFCPITSTGFWLTRRAGKISLTGNTNYGGKARTAGISCKMTTHEAETAQRRWFALHPGIKRWHDRTMAQLRGTRRVRNSFGYERPYLGRIESVLPEALAWIPQSTVALAISDVHARFDACLYSSFTIEVQMQCYDSLAGQFPTAHRDEALAHMSTAWRSVVVPYADPFVIPLDLALSTSSWGECARVAWPAVL